MGKKAGANKQGYMVGTDGKDSMLFQKRTWLKTCGKLCLGIAGEGRKEKRMEMAEYLGESTPHMLTKVHISLSVKCRQI